jgi:hypothetical protein
VLLGVFYRVRASSRGVGEGVTVAGGGAFARQQFQSRETTLGGKMEGQR